MTPIADPVAALVAAYHGHTTTPALLVADGVALGVWLAYSYLTRRFRIITLLPVAVACWEIADVWARYGPGLAATQTVILTGGAILIWREAHLVTTGHINPTAGLGHPWRRDPKRVTRATDTDGALYGTRPARTRKGNGRKAVADGTCQEPATQRGPTRRIRPAAPDRPDSSRPNPIRPSGSDRTVPDLDREH